MEGGNWNVRKRLFIGDEMMASGLSLIDALVAAQEDAKYPLNWECVNGIIVSNDARAVYEVEQQKPDVHD